MANVNSLDARRGVGTYKDDACEVRTEAHGGWSSGWCAQILAVDEDKPGGFKLKFLEGDSDYRNRSGNGTRVFVLGEPGLYQADSVYRSYRSHRVLFRLDEDLKLEILSATADGDTMAKLKRTAAEALA